MNKVPIIMLTGALASLYIGIIELALLMGLGTVVTAKTLSEGKTGSKSSSKPKVKVQPIKIKRTWDKKVKSIYPEKMVIDLKPPRTGLSGDRLEKGMGFLGKSIGSTIKKARGGKKDED